MPALALVIYWDIRKEYTNIGYTVCMWVGKYGSLEINMAVLPETLHLILLRLQLEDEEEHDDARVAMMM